MKRDVRLAANLLHRASAIELMRGAARFRSVTADLTVRSFALEVEAYSGRCDMRTYVSRFSRRVSRPIPGAHPVENGSLRPVYGHLKLTL